MKYYYFISYFSSSNKNNTRALSSCELTRDKKITDYEDIISIGKLLEEKYNRKNVVIINYTLLKKVKE